jgi:hypothetical protein
MPVDSITCLKLVFKVSINAGKLVAPALQVLLGGGILGTEGSSRLKSSKSRAEEDLMPYDMF